MQLDVIELAEFYRGRLGQVARRLVRRRVRGLLPDARGLRVLGLGYATPYLRLFRDEAERVVAVMPARQGVMRWPADARNLVALSEEAELPFRDASFDRVLMMHALESTEQIRPMLREVWRVLTDSGRLILVVPNRRGMWAHFERTPLGQGQPYSQPQLTRLLRDTLFSPLHWSHGLYPPPWDFRPLLRAAGVIEQVGSRVAPGFAGVLLVEASKQMYAAVPQRARARRRILVPLPGRAATARQGPKEPR